MDREGSQEELPGEAFQVEAQERTMTEMLEPTHTDRHGTTRCQAVALRKLPLKVCS